MHLIGRERYFNKYINVRKTNVAPVGQFVAMVIIMSYVWRYEGESEYSTRYV